MTILPADYVIATAALVAGVFGMFGGFSGALAFLSGVAGAGLAVHLGRGMLAELIAAQTLRLIALLLLALLAFGVVRLIVKRTVHGLLAQPADALFGLLTAAVAGGGMALAAAYALDRLGVLAVDSALLRFATGLVLGP
jgi:hypothetical protein